MTGCGICEESCGADLACDNKEPGTDFCDNNCRLPTRARACGSFGDVDHNGLITATDSEMVLDFIAGNAQFTPTQIEEADVDDDPAVISSRADVTSIDSQLILQYITGQINTFPVCG